MAVPLTSIDVAERPVADYEDSAGPDILAHIRSLAEPLRGARILHVAAAGPGGRAAEQLGSLLPLLRGLGIRAEWGVLAGGGVFSAVARQLDDGIRGAETAISAEDWRAYRDAWARVDLSGFDLVVAHDPSALGTVAGAPESSSPPIVWCCHLDASAPDPAAWERAGPCAGAFEACVFPLGAFAPAGLDRERVHEIQPALDPLGPRNRDLPVKLAGDSLRFLGIDLSRPFACQIGALDPWRDPHEVIDAFRLAKEEIPDLQLVLGGTPAREDAESWRLAGEVADYAEEVEDLLVLTGYVGAGDLELNAMQRLARVAVQKSIGEGFAIAASEALWKGTPVVASAAGGVPEQMVDGEHGFLTDGVEATAAAMVDLVRDPALAITMGAAGRDRVRERFLVTRALADELRLLHAVLEGRDATVSG